MVKKKPTSSKKKKKAVKSGKTSHKRPGKPGTKRPAKVAQQKKHRKPTVVKKHSKPALAAKSHQPAKKTSEAKSVEKKPAHHPVKPAAKAKHAPAESAEPQVRLTPEQLRQQIVAKARGGAKPHRAVAFTLDDVRGELARATPSKTEKPTAPNDQPGDSKRAQPAHKKVVEARVEQRHYGAVSLADILGYNPTKNERPADEEASIDKRFVRYYRLLVELRDHVNSGLQTHAEETLKRSSRDDTGDLSGYGQHMADAGTDNFDRDFALSLVSNEQEALYEIEEAIKRIKNGTYGVCELTGKPISKERLLAVPFARYSVESQTEIEKMQRRSAQRGGVFGEASGEEGAKFLEEEAE